MKNNLKMFKASLAAQGVKDSFLIAYWSPETEEYHFRRAVEKLYKLAASLGFEVTKSKTLEPVENVCVGDSVLLSGYDDGFIVPDGWHTVTSLDDHGFFRVGGNTSLDPRRVSEIRKPLRDFKTGVKGNYTVKTP